MQQTDQDFFRQLKNRIASTYSAYAKSEKALAEWTQYDINNFQEHLEEKVKDRVSEKWVYLHLKKDSDKVPRIDVLNLLSRYVDFTSWDDFKNANRLPAEEEKKTEELKHEETKKEEIIDVAPGKARAFAKSTLWVVGGLLVLALAFYLLMMKQETCNKTILVFKDAYTLQTIPYTQLELTEIRKNKILKGNEVCLDEKDSLIYTVKGTYYKSMTFSIAGSDKKDTVFTNLYPDDYALILHYFSLSSPKDWQKRREQLGEIIHDAAKIFQVHDSLNGLEILNKEEFVDRLTLPAQSLKEIKILDIEYKDDKIYRLRFKQDL